MERNARNYTTLVDEYELTMSESYLKDNMKDTEAVFDVFFRKVPNDGGYAVMAGLDKVIEYIKNLKFTEENLTKMKKDGYSDEFINYLRNFKFHGNIYAIPDGTPVFPNEPLITVKAPIIEAQIIETALLTMVNGSMEHATGARRIIEATPKNVKVMEFGARRADGCEAAIDSSIYGVMAGCAGTSNRMAADYMNLKPLGTMAHSYIESFDTEEEAFSTFAKRFSNNCIVLVDTFDTLRSGVINAIKVFNYMKENNYNLDHIGIRIDSGDLAYLSKEARRMLDGAGFPNATICLSNGLDASTIESLVNQGACFNSLGVGDNISKPNGRMGAVYKEVALFKDGIEIPKIKISGDIIKIVNPGYKKVYRAYDKDNGYAIADIICRHNEELNKDEMTLVSITDFISKKTINNYRLENLQKEIFRDGILVYKDPTILEKRDYCEKQMSTIYPEVKRIMNPHIHCVGGTEEYTEFKKDIINKTNENIGK